jgi:hypothetical protein
MKMKVVAAALFFLPAADATVLYFLDEFHSKLHACEVGTSARCHNIGLDWTMTAGRCPSGLTVGTNDHLHVASGCPQIFVPDNRICVAPTDGSGHCRPSNTGFKYLRSQSGITVKPGMAADGDHVWVLDRAGYPDGQRAVNLCPSAGSVFGCKSVDADFYKTKSWGGYHPIPMRVKIYKNEAFIVHASGPSAEQDEPWGVRACTTEGVCREVGNWTGLKFMDDLVVVNDTVFTLYNNATYRYEGNYSVRACHIYSDRCWDLGGSFEGGDIAPSIIATKDRIFVGVYQIKKMPEQVPRGSLSSSRLDGGGWEAVPLGDKWGDWINVKDISIAGDFLYVGTDFKCNATDTCPQDLKILKCPLSGGDCEDTGVPHDVLDTNGHYIWDLEACEACKLKEQIEVLV